MRYAPSSLHDALPRTSFAAFLLPFVLRALLPAQSRPALAVDGLVLTLRSEAGEADVVIVPAIGAPFPDHSDGLGRCA